MIVGRPLAVSHPIHAVRRVTTNLHEYPQIYTRLHKSPKTNLHKYPQISTVSQKNHPHSAIFITAAVCLPASQPLNLPGDICKKNGVRPPSLPDLYIFLQNSTDFYRFSRFPYIFVQISFDFSTGLYNCQQISTGCTNFYRFLQISTD